MLNYSSPPGRVRMFARTYAGTGQLGPDLVGNKSADSIGVVPRRAELQGKTLPELQSKTLPRRASRGALPRHRGNAFDRTAGARGDVHLGHPRARRRHSSHSRRGRGQGAQPRVVRGPGEPGMVHRKRSPPRRRARLRLRPSRAEPGQARLAAGRLRHHLRRGPRQRGNSSARVEETRQGAAPAQ